VYRYELGRDENDHFYVNTDCTCSDEKTYEVSLSIHDSSSSDSSVTSSSSSSSSKSSSSSDDDDNNHHHNNNNNNSGSYYAISNVVIENGKWLHPGLSEL
jgi:hypothetical protein